MLYTGKGDDGKTKTFGCDQKISKSSIIAEALGVLDEANSFLGVVRSKTKELKINIDQEEINFAELVLEMEQNLFIVQAEIAGATLAINKEKVKKIEKIVNEIEKILPPIDSFFLSGSTEISSLFDFARTLIRRAERRVVEVKEEEKTKIGEDTLAYLNRLSSLLYALARASCHLEGGKEIKPEYK